MEGSFSLDIPNIAPSLAALLRAELRAGNRIGEIWVGRPPHDLRVVLRKPFLVQHHLPAGVRHQTVSETGGRCEEYVSEAHAHALASPGPPAPPQTPPAEENR